MSAETSGSASIQISASPQQVYDYLTDLEKLPELSPENVRCEFLEGSSSIEVGSTFRGHNENGGYEWHADCKVTQADAGEAFTFQVPPDFEHATVWSYQIEADGEGSKVTESFEAPLLAMPDIYPGKIEGRRDNLQAAIESTLANLKQALES